MYEKTLTIGTTKVNSAYEWQKVRYNKNQTTATTTTKATSPKAKQQKSSKNNNNNNSNKTISNSAKNATKTHTEHLNSTTKTTATKPGLTTLGTLTVPTVKPATQTPLFKKFVGNAARRQTLAHQIKRAHRHLLTSGGNDKQPQKQTRNNNNNTKQCISKQKARVQCKTYLIFVVYNINKYFLHCIATQLHVAFGPLYLCVSGHTHFLPAIDIGICRPADFARPTIIDIDI